MEARQKGSGSDASVCNLFLHLPSYVLLSWQVQSPQPTLVLPQLHAEVEQVTHPGTRPCQILVFAPEVPKSPSLREKVNP